MSGGGQSEIFDSEAGRELRDVLAFASRLLFRLDVRPSHVSARVPGTTLFIVKARGGSPSAVDRDHMALCDLSGNGIAGAAPPLELPLHTEIYRVRPDVMAVAHTHQPVATAALNAAPDARDDIARYPSPEQISTVERGVALAQALGDSALAHLWDHGIAIAGATIDEVAARIVELEQWARTQGTNPINASR